MTLEQRVANLEAEVKWLRGRVNSLLPERHHCQYCRAIIHKAAKACGACGRSWGNDEEESKKGLPT